MKKKSAVGYVYPDWGYWFGHYDKSNMGNARLTISPIYKKQRKTYQYRKIRITIEEIK